MPGDPFLTLGLALAAGLLTALQRERSRGPSDETETFLGGARTATHRRARGRAILMNSWCFALIAVVAVGNGAPPADSVARKYTLPSGVEVTIVEAPFAKARFKVSGCGSDAEPCHINGRVPFGSSAGLPRTYVSRIALKWKGKTHVLDSSDMYDAWGDRPLEYHADLRYLGGGCTDELNCQIRGLFSDASEAFVAEWKVVDGVSIRTVLTDSSDVIALFMSSIDPATYE